MEKTLEQCLAALRDLIKINAVVATELIQLVENSSRQLRGAIPEDCRVQHRQLKKEVIEIAQKWHDHCDILKAHNLTHDDADSEASNHGSAASFEEEKA